MSELRKWLDEVDRKQRQAMANKKKLKEKFLDFTLVILVILLVIDLIVLFVKLNE